MQAAAAGSDPVVHLREALERDAFEVYAQPIASLGRVLAYPLAEVLVRMRAEEEARQHPGEFLQVLEHFGLMPELDRWLVRRALQHLGSGCRIPRLALHLSSQSLADPGFPVFFADELAVYGVPGDRLLFQISETDAGAAPDCSARFAATVGSLGAGIVLEDYGATPSSFELLQLPCLQLVKLHGSLVRRLATAPGASAELAEMVQAAITAGLEVVADCVESRALLSRLRMLKISYVQGLGIYEPHPLGSFLERQALELA